MAPNLLVATQTLFTPHKWFTRKSSEKSVRRSEHWNDPMPGTYEYIPGRGWYLARPDAADGSPGERLEKPRPVKYSRVLRRYLFDAEYQRRKLSGEITDSHGKVREAGFFLLDDGIAWVNCWNHKGEFVPGPYERWVIDERNEKFRKMLKGDDPEWRKKHTTTRRTSGDRPRRSASVDSDEDDKNRVYQIPSVGHSRPASTIDMMLNSPPASRPPSPKNGMTRSEGVSRVNSRVNSGANSCANSIIGVKLASRPSNLRENSSSEADTPVSVGSSSTTISNMAAACSAHHHQSLAAAVSSRLEEQSLAQQRVH
ncbi:pyranose 2-oxidase [Diplodia corticola]|uniref:Pyranose 2-oxidase n=1 Tax=Diplodia corticola TaxID=236234 RepID=A0A1J9RRZ0_9PEZI|nr:pyranose 2-oxidase [Diplodia corticola]OJD31199.1 pyranose 2-oxidase [Diplodia corticola]